MLDFGLAKNLLPSLADIPTQTALRTQIGAVMGTMPYMTPEQARGDAVDRRTDIWSLGVVLYEMLTGRLPFRGDSSTDTLARIIETQPDFSLLPADTPRAARHLLERCLEKNKKRRFQHVGDVRIEIEDAFAGCATARETVRFKAGDVAYPPRGVPHALSYPGTVPNRTRFITTPGGSENLYKEAEELMSGGSVDMQQFVRLAGKYGITFVPPPAG